MNVANYLSLGKLSLFAGIPIQYLQEFKEFLKQNNIKYRIVFRGPRNASVGDFRHKFARQSWCLKENATHFSVYRPARKY